MARIANVFEQGVGFMYDLAATGDVPASVRLVDNLQFQFGQALKPKKEGLAVWKSRLEKLYVLNVKGFEADQMVACLRSIRQPWPTGS